MILHARDSLVVRRMQRWQVEVDPTPRTSAMSYLEYSLDSASFWMMIIDVMHAVRGDGGIRDE